jgi:Elongation complex protein 6
MFEDLARVLGHMGRASPTQAHETVRSPGTGKQESVAGDEVSRDDGLPSGECFVVRDQLRCDGSFVLHYFLHVFLARSARTALIACAHPLFHYQSVAKKSVGCLLSSPLWTLW